MKVQVLKRKDGKERMMKVQGWKRKNDEGSRMEKKG